MRALLLLLLLPVAAYAQDLPHVRATLDTLSSEADLNGHDLFAGCSLACALDWTTRASSTLAAQGANAYAVSNLYDGRGRTAWVEGAPGHGEGERLTFSIQPLPGYDGEDYPDIPFDGLFVVNGHSKSETAWRANGRVREARLRINEAPVLTFMLHDDRRPQHVAFPPGLTVTFYDDVVVEIVSVYPGERYADTAISELALLGAH